MDDRTIQIRVGVVVVTAAIIAFLLVLFFGEKRSLFQQQKTIYLLFRTAPGVSPQTPVRKNGVLIGRITHVELRDEGGVTLTAKIESQYKVLRNEVARISTASFIGDAVLEFIPSDVEGASNEEIADEEVIADGVVSADPLRVLANLEPRLAGAIGSIENAGNEVTQLARNLNTIVGNNQDQFQRVIQKSELAMEHFRSAMETVDEVVGDPELKANLKRSLRELPQFFDDSRATLTEAQKTLTGFQKMTARADSNLENLEKFTKPLSEKGEVLADRIESAVINVDTLLDQLVKFSEQLNSSEGTLGQLLNDKDLYNRLHRSAVNIEDATRRIRPILDDVRIITDKVATDPRQMGVKGMLDKRPSGIGMKRSPRDIEQNGLRQVEAGIWIENFRPGELDGAQEVEIQEGSSLMSRIPWRPSTRSGSANSSRR